jgi:hypothetical protein
MPLDFVVSSAGGANGGLNALLRFSPDGRAQGDFGAKAGITDPRGLHVSGDRRHLYVNSSDRVVMLGADGIAVASIATHELDLGGANLGPDGQYYATSRSTRTLVAFTAELTRQVSSLPPSSVSFPRGFAFAADGRLFFSSGVAPSGQGDNTIALFSASMELTQRRFVEDSELSPLDLTIAPNGNIVVSSEFPFGAPDARATIREYESTTGQLLRVLDAGPTFHRPRGLRFAADGRLFCVGEDEVVAFDFERGTSLGPVVRLPRLNGQAIEFFPTVPN